MAACQTSKSAFLFSGMGLGFCTFGLFLINREHPYASFFIFVLSFVLGFLFFSVARVRLEDDVLRYGRWYLWQAVSYSEITDCGESGILGYIRLRHYVFPLGRIYFARSYSSDSFFGLDKEMISSIRSRANIAA
jgi:hypothetical protein